MLGDLLVWREKLEVRGERAHSVSQRRALIIVDAVYRVAIDEVLPRRLPIGTYHEDKLSAFHALLAIMD